MNDKRALHAGDVLLSRQRLGDEGLERRQVARDAFQQEVDFAREHVALTNLWPSSDPLLEVLEIRIMLARESDEDETRDFEAERPGVEIGVIALDIARLLERAHAPQAGRRGDLGATRQFHIGDTAIGLELAQYPQIDRVELVMLHEVSSSRYG